MGRINMEIDFKIFDNLGHPNKNGVVFTKECIENAIKEWQENGKQFGELAPDYGTDPMIIHTGKITHKVNNIYINDNQVWANTELLETPLGNVAKQLLDAGRELNFAPRMLGGFEEDYEIDENGNKTPKLDENGNPIMVVTNPKIITVDIV